MTHKSKITSAASPGPRIKVRWQW